MKNITQIKNKTFKTIAMCLMMFVFSVSAAYAQEVSSLEVVFETDPLFSEIGVLPGDGITKDVTVTNNTEESQNIIMEAINAVDSDGLGNELNLVITENSTELYSGTLGDFMRTGEVPLSILGNGDTATYILSVSFREGADNFTQSGTLGFDLCVGFFGGDSNCGNTEIGGEGSTDDGGTGNGTSGGTISGSGGGIVHITPLKIENERVTNVAVDNNGIEGTATIEWDTNLLATSQVIYGPATDGVGGPELFYSLNLTVSPYFGYPYATDEDSVKMAQHTLVIEGLDPDQLYKYRVVSRASPPTVSYEHTFIANPETTTVDVEVPVVEKEKDIYIAPEIKNTQSDTGISISSVISALDVSLDDDTAISSNEEEIFEPEVEGFEDSTMEDIEANNGQTAAAFLSLSNFSVKHGLYLLLILFVLFVLRSIWKKLNSTEI